MAAWDKDRNPEWAELRPTPKVPAVRRGTNKAGRRGKARGMHMSQFFAMSDEERRMTYEISKAGRRPR